VTPPVSRRKETLRGALLTREAVARESAESVEIVHGPGRVNLIGEHTDYNEGFVLPVAIDLGITMALIPTGDRRVRITQLDGALLCDFDLDALPAPSGQSTDYIVGTAWSLADAGSAMRGFRAVLGSDLPIAAGLSSSAALELAAVWALLAPEGRPRSDGDRMQLARLAQRAENEYVGVRCGLMDQFASSLGGPGRAMLLDCRSLAFRSVRLPLEDHVLVVCDSVAPRSLAATAYNTRRAECDTAVEIISSRYPSVRSLRDVSAEMLDDISTLLDSTLLRRVTHVVLENARVLACAEALEAGDLRAIGAHFAASHASLRDLYEVSSPELDALVEVALSIPGTVGARMTGAGFGGSTVNLVARNAVARFEEIVVRDYGTRTGLTARVLPVEPVAGAGLVR
jgi:galactokinase